MPQQKVDIDEAQLQAIKAVLDAMWTDVDRERAWFVRFRGSNHIQPHGQVWSLADRLVATWDQRISALSQWYDQLSSDLWTLTAKLDAAREKHNSAEETAVHLATQARNY